MNYSLKNIISPVGIALHKPIIDKILNTFYNNDDQNTIKGGNDAAAATAATFSVISWVISSVLTVLMYIAGIYLMLKCGKVHWMSILAIIFICPFYIVYKILTCLV